MQPCRQVPVPQNLVVHGVAELKVSGTQVSSRTNMIRPAYFETEPSLAERKGFLLVVLISISGIRWPKRPVPMLLGIPSAQPTRQIYEQECDRNNAVAGDSDVRYKC